MGDALLQRWRPAAPRLWMWSADLGIFLLSGILAFLLRFEFELSEYYTFDLLLAPPIWVAVKALAFSGFSLHRSSWRSVSIPDVERLVYANVTGSAVSCVLIAALLPAGFPRSVYLLDLLICLLCTCGVRIATRRLREPGPSRDSEVAPPKRVFIYGAGSAGLMLLRGIRCDTRLNYKIDGFIDDDPRKKGLRIQGVPIFGGGRDLRHLAAKHRSEEVLIAIPSATGAEMSLILRHCQKAGLKCKTIPGLADLIDGPAIVNQIRDVQVEDLLERKPVRLEESVIEGKLRDQTVMVTGAAGSIGSELCRQVARFGPRAIIGFEISETALFHLDREMRSRFPDVPFHPEIGNIQNTARLDEVLKRFSPSVLYHAAAYKHVPLMEMHAFEAVENNIFGTYNVAVAASRHGVRDFVMISSDKAVRPANLMGASKRAAELVIRGLQNGSTKFVSVRFGNVLGSNGSVIPIFKQQISAGGPVTVTHPEMRRYFMTIPEACQLVLQASTMGSGGEIYVLDMGDTVRILDLARNLIRLSGLRPDKDIKIVFTGVRPGEKLFEELNALEEDTLPTYHEKIRIFSGGTIAHHELSRRLTVLRELCEERNLPQLVLTLKDLVPDYNPSTHLLRRMVPETTKRMVISAARVV